MNPNEITVAIIGATGAVGTVVLELFEDNRFLPVNAKLRLFASSNSAGKELDHRGKKICIEQLEGRNSFEGINYAIFCSNAEISRKFAPLAVAADCIVIDNSSAFRMRDTVPLVVPEVNADDLDWHEGIIANPNCSTAILVMALAPLHKKYGLKNVIVSTYQAVSGAGVKGVQYLHAQMREYCEDFQPNFEKSSGFFAYPIACNVLPSIGSYDLNTEDARGYTSEELKIQTEGSKILNLIDFRASVTCVRVPVIRAHSLSVIAQFTRSLSTDLDVIRGLYDGFPGVQICDNPSRNDYPTPLRAEGREHCLVGRLRHDTVIPNALSFFVCGDQLLKGAALNAVQILDCLLRKKPK